MTNRLFSFIGIGKYKPCIYEMGGLKASETPFVQFALLELLEAQGHVIDELVIFATDVARLENGAVFKREFRESGKDTPYRFVRLQGNVTADRTWDFFDSIYEEIGEKDRIFVDISHGFRSFPLTVIPILQYAKQLKKIEIGGIYYGNFEAKTVAKEDKIIAPIDDLTDLLAFLDWSYAINVFVSTGDAKKLVELAEAAELSQPEPLQSGFRSKRLAKTMQNFSRALETCRAVSSIKQAQRVKANIAEATEDPVGYHKPLANLFHIVAEKMAPFSGDPIMDPYYAIHWCIEHGLTQQAYTMLYEHIITTLCLALRVDSLDKGTRNAVTGGIGVTIDRKPENSWYYRNADEKRLMKHTKELLQADKNVISTIESLREFRHDLNHAEYRAGASRPHTFENKIREIANNLEPFFRDIQKRLKAHPETAAGKA